MFLYILSIYFLSNLEGYNEISNVIALLLIGVIWIYFFLKNSNFKFNNFLLIYLLFIFVSLISILYALDQGVSIIRIRTLILLYVLMLSLVNYIDTLEKVISLMRYFAISGFLASCYILLTSDFSQISRFGQQLGNVNTMGLVISISTVFCLYFIFEEKKTVYIPMILINLTTILLTGSRKALLFVGFSLIIVFLSRIKKPGIKSMGIILVTSLLIFVVGFYIIYQVPIFYQIVGKRMETLWVYALGGEVKEISLNERSYMIQTGLNFIKEKPFLGYGIDNYQTLFKELPFGRETYSHNNFLELLVGVGLFGTILYYSTNIIVIIGLLKAKKYIPKTLCYSFLAIILGYLIMSIGLVYYYDKHISILLAVSSIIYRLSKYEKDTFNQKINN